MCSLIRVSVGGLTRVGDGWYYRDVIISAKCLRRDCVMSGLQYARLSGYYFSSCDYFAWAFSP